MKHFMLLKLPFLAFGIGAALLLTPACKAQSEVSPDHFDGTDCWAVAARTVPTPMQSQAMAKTSLQAKSQKTVRASAFQLAAAREVTKPASGNAVAIDRQRKPVARNPEK